MYKNFVIAAVMLGAACCIVPANGMSSADAQNITKSLADALGIGELYNRLAVIGQSSQPHSELQQIWKHVADHPALDKWCADNPTLWDKMKSIL